MMRTNLNEIHLGKRLVASRFLNVEDRNNVLVVEVAQEFHLAERS